MHSGRDLQPIYLKNKNKSVNISILKVSFHLEHMTLLSLDIKATKAEKQVSQVIIYIYTYRYIYFSSCKYKYKRARSLVLILMWRLCVK